MKTQQSINQFIKEHWSSLTLDAHNFLFFILRPHVNLIRADLKENFEIMKYN